MATMNISLPDDMKAFVDEQVRTRGDLTASEYVRDVLRTEKEMAELRAKIDEGHASPASDLDKSYFEKLRQRIRNRE